jgi:hypothetical protein
MPEDFLSHFVQVAANDATPAVRLSNALPDRLGEPGTDWFVWKKLEKSLCDRKLGFWDPVQQAVEIVPRHRHTITLLF